MTKNFQDTFYKVGNITKHSKRKWAIPHIKSILIISMQCQKQRMSIYLNHKTMVKKKKAEMTTRYSRLPGKFATETLTSEALKSYIKVTEP